MSAINITINTAQQKWYFGSLEQQGNTIYHNIYYLVRVYDRACKPLSKE